MLEERSFRPFDVADGVTGFFHEARLLVAGNSAVAIQPGQQRTVTESELVSGHFVLELAPGHDAFQQLIGVARAELGDIQRDAAVGLVVIAGSPYLKLAEVIHTSLLDELERSIDLRDGPIAEPFHATRHGCDINAYLALLTERRERPFEPWRKGTWLARGSFGLRTNVDGFGYAIHPLTDEKRQQLLLPNKVLRYVNIELSPLDIEAGAGGDVDVYVDADLLARLERESSKPWAIAFTDQLALDFLSAIVLRAVATPQLRDMDWDAVAGTLLGSVIELVARTGDETVLQQYLNGLKANPTRFTALLENRLDMRANAKRLQVG